MLKVSLYYNNKKDVPFLKEITITGKLFAGNIAKARRRMDLYDKFIKEANKDIEEWVKNTDKEMILTLIDGVYNDYIAGKRRLKDIEYSIEINPSALYLGSLTIEGNHYYVFKRRCSFF